MFSVPEDSTCFPECPDAFPYYDEGTTVCKKSCESPNLSHVDSEYKCSLNCPDTHQYRVDSSPYEYVCYSGCPKEFPYYTKGLTYQCYA